VGRTPGRNDWRSRGRRRKLGGEVHFGADRQPANAPLYVGGCLRELALDCLSPLLEVLPGRPSDADMRSWAARLTTGLYRYVGIIATHDLPGSTTPVLTAWVTQGDGSGGLVCDPATIIETGWYPHG
jgi:hypothetical protein